MLKGGSTWYHIAWTLVIIGGLNWGLVGLFQFNLVEALLGGMPTLERLVYVLVGVSAIVMIGMYKNHCGAGKKK